MRYILMIMILTMISFDVWAQMLPPPSETDLSEPIPLMTEETFESTQPIVVQTQDATPKPAVESKLVIDPVPDPVAAPAPTPISTPAAAPPVDPAPTQAAAPVPPPTPVQTIPPEEKPVNKAAIPQFDPAHNEQHSSLCRIINAQAEKQKTVAPADYVPGVDVHGRRVAGANVQEQSGSIKAFDYPLHLPLELDLAEYAGIELNDSIKDAASLKPTIAFISIHEDGHIEYNNQDVTSQIHEVCQ